MDQNEHAADVIADEDIGTNLSGNPHLMEVLDTRLSRREVLAGGMTATSAALLGGSALGLAGCTSDDDSLAPSRLGFAAVPKSTADVVSVPPGYTVSVLWALGDSFASDDTAWAADGSETGESYTRRAGDHHDGLYFFGLNAAGTAADPLGTAGGNSRGILAMNHEAPNPFTATTGVNNLYVHPSGATIMVTGTAPPNPNPSNIPDTRVANRTVADQVIKEINHHGVSLIEIEKAPVTGVWGIRKGTIAAPGNFNRRVTGATTIDITGPLRSNAALITKFSPTATQTQGTVNNCANGYTPWGTYLTCEENWAGYFARAVGDNAKRSDPTKNNINDTASLARYGNGENTRQRLNWNTAGSSDDFKRWDTSVTGASLDGSDDFRNVINQFGYVVEIDPYNNTAVPAKRTALGRMAHEGAWPSKPVAGKPLVWYMGDDNRGDYIYKFVSKVNWDPADAVAAQTLSTDRMAIGAKYLDAGKLFVAKFNNDGSGTWLLIGDTDSADSNLRVQGFLNSRVRADAAGATRMDRPEWGAVHPDSGEVYLTLTNSNSSNRLVSGTPSGNAALTDAANPRAYSDPRTDGGSAGSGNPNGHIVRWRETGDEPAATSFRWDIYLFGARSTASANVNLSQLTDDNDMSSPDGLWFSRPTGASNGLLWIQTDDGAYTDVTNCMMLAAVPGSVGDGFSTPVTSVSGSNSRTVTTFVGKSADYSNLRRFLVGPKECEITGVDTTPDGKTMFVNIQHPGEDKQATILADNSQSSTYGSRWPGSQFGASFGARPRSATVVITKNDGGVIGL